MTHRTVLLLIVLCGALLPELAPAQGPKIRVCATTPDLGSLVSEIGGDHVDVTVFARGPEDPHYLNARPSFIKSLSKAELFFLVGLDLEAGWAPPVWQNARNARVQPGGEGFVDASAVVNVRSAPQGTVDRSMGDVHVLGNPHYLLDPVNGLRVAKLVHDRLASVRPELSDYFKGRLGDFKQRLESALVGEKLASKYNVEKLCRLHEHGKLLPFLKAQGLEGALGGWLGKLEDHRGAALVADHNLWPYFAARFGLEIEIFLEPKPGITPTTQHLARVVEQVATKKAKGILSVPYYSPRYSRFVSQKSGAKIAQMCHQVNAIKGVSDYVGMVQHNVDQIVATLSDS